jgi:uncharacterized phiE125 gp8 family phage protein
LSLRLKTAPSLEPLSLADAKLHLRIDTDLTEDDTTVSALISAVRRDCEAFQRRAYITQSWLLTLDNFPSEAELWPYSSSRVIEIPRPPLQSITSIKYLGRVDALDSDFDSAYDSVTKLHTLNPDFYQVDIQSEPGRVAPIPTMWWPFTRFGQISPSLNGVTIEFVAGYGSTAAAVPAEVVQAMKLMLGGYYENREAVLTGARAVAIKVPGAETLLWRDRVIGL